MASSANPFNSPKPLSIGIPNSSAYSPPGTPGAATPGLANNATELEALGLPQNYRNFFESRKQNVIKYRNNTKEGPFGAASVKNAINHLRKQNAKAASEAKAVSNEAARLEAALIKDRNYDVRSIIPIDFKGDGIGYTAGFGYNLKKERGFGNFVKGFPLKYYRVYGNSMNNITKKIVRLRKDIDDAAKALVNAREKAKAQQADLKSKFAQNQATARAALAAEKATRNALLQQERNAALGMMQAKRVTTRSLVNARSSSEAMNLAQKQVFDLLKADITKRLQNPNDPVYGSYANAGINSFDKLDPDFKDELLRKARRSPAFMNRVRKTARLPLSALRQYNKAKYALGFGRTARNKTLRSKPLTGSKAFQQGFNTASKNGTKKNTRSFMNRLFRRKPKNNTNQRVGNAYAAMNQPVASLGNAYASQP